MGERSKVLELPPAKLEELNQRLQAGGFSGYVELETWLRASGHEISKSALHRYGSKFQAKIEQLKASADRARLMAEALPDNDASLSRGLMRLYQQKLWDAMEGMEVDPEAIDLNKVGRMLAPLVRADVKLSEYAASVRAKTEAVVGELAQAQGMTAEQADFWMRKFLGVVTD